MSDCLFCKIASKAIPAEVVYEDDEVFAFLDINPVNPGHVLVMPKKHYEDFMDMPEEVCLPLVRMIKRVMSVQIDGLGYEGVNLFQNNKPAAGQVIPHLHFHVIPRKTSDGYVHWHGHEYGNGEAAIMGAKIRESLKNL
ncbi:MAG: HIT family protein [Patescibacteria group bacterium]|nr:HIT family protein [Patescibacteria group bacterium]